MEQTITPFGQLQAIFESHSECFYCIVECTRGDGNLTCKERFTSLIEELTRCNRSSDCKVCSVKRCNERNCQVCADNLKEVYDTIKSGTID